MVLYFGQTLGLAIFPLTLNICGHRSCINKMRCSLGLFWQYHSKFLSCNCCTLLPDQDFFTTWKFDNQEMLQEKIFFLTKEEKKLPFFQIGEVKSKSGKEKIFKSGEQKLASKIMPHLKGVGQYFSPLIYLQYISHHVMS